MVDTTAAAAQTPDVEQPWADLGLKDDEYDRIRAILRRRPTAAELAMYSVMWSEHCSYKSSKVHLRRFGELPATTPRGDLLAGIGENAGVVDIGNGWAATFKIESHNHPSFVEPHQGAATGVGGIVRDILAMGARPVGVMDSLRFGPLDAPDTHRVLPGVVSGVGTYGNCLGLPNIGGEAFFDASYAGNPLVNALCVGVLRHEDLHLAHASGVGNKVVLYGAATGGDGIGGVSVLASETFDADGPAKRPSVQVGDPFMEKLLIECTLELFAAGLITGIQDLGGAGLSCATSELASAGDGGMHIDLDAVPLRDSSLSPEEILMSESQERMMAVVEPGDVEQFLAICAKWDVRATVIGEVTDGDRLVIDWHGETVVDVPPRTVAHEGPVYERPFARPGWIDQVNARDAESLARDGVPLREQMLRVLAAPNLADRSWITEQYDRYVLGDTVLARPETCGMIRVADAGLGVALAVSCNGRMALLNPYLGAQHALAQAYRTVAATGAQPVAVSDCLNFGSPEDPAAMWQFVEAILGLVDGCRELGTPVTGGNVSFYNQTGDTAILPTPTVGVLGVIDDVTTRLSARLGPAGTELWLVGASREELSGSVWAEVIHAHLGGMPPQVDLAAEQRLAELVRAGHELLVSARPLAEGGLFRAVVESAVLAGRGVRVEQQGDAVAWWFAESSARLLVGVHAGQGDAWAAACQTHGVPAVRVGEVADDQAVTLGEESFAVADLADVWRAPIPAAMEA